MSQSHKPDGYPTVSPYLVVEDANGTIEFLVKVFGAKELRRFSSPEGDTRRIMHAEVRLDDSVVMLADSNAQWPPVGSNVHVYVPNVDETYQQALAAGATSVQEPKQEKDEDKRGGVRDVGGTTWWMATRVG